MLKDEYLHNIISNLGIAITPENNKEIIVKCNIFYDKKYDIYTLSDEYKIFYQDYGTIITDFQNTNFSEKEQFISFFDKYCLFGLENKKITTLFKNGQCSSNDYLMFVEKIIKKYKKTLILYQNDINSILDYCLFNPHKKTLSLTPFKRLCMLEYLPNNPSLLQDNSMQVIHLNTIANVDNPKCTEIELIDILNSSDSNVYSNKLYIPFDISSLLHFELTEIIKDNIIMKCCNYCGKYFIAQNRHINYCSNIAPGYATKTCKQIAKNKKYLESHKKDIALALFMKKYNNKAYKATRYKDITAYQIDYNHYKLIGRKKVNAYKSKKITQEEFIDWIKSQ